MENKAVKNVANGYGDLWGTPPDLWAEICAREFPYVDRPFDPCPGRQPLASTCCYSNTDGLEVDWTNFSGIFVNPPFSDIEPWIKKADDSVGHLNRVVMLVPVRTDQPWWHKYTANATIVWIQGRVQYINHTTGAPGKAPAFSSCLLRFGEIEQKPPEFWWPQCHFNRRKRYITQTTGRV